MICQSIREWGLAVAGFLWSNTRASISGCQSCECPRVLSVYNALLRVPALTRKGLAGRLKVAPQTGPCGFESCSGFISEVTGEFSGVRDVFVQDNAAWAGKRCIVTDEAYTVGDIPDAAS